MSRPQLVRVPWRVVASAAYADATVATYIKIAALARPRMVNGHRIDGCEAGVAYLSGLLGLSRSAIERALTQLGRPDPADDVVELTTTRRTLPGGTGTTAVRRPRAVHRPEAFVEIPSRAPEALTPRHLRAYAALAYAQATGQPVAYSELGSVLRHRSGARAGQPLGDRSVARIIGHLEDSGWISIDRRAGSHGRHEYQVHQHPFQQLALPADLDDGSGGDLECGSLATKEDPQIDPPVTPPGGPIRRRRGTGTARGPVENPPLPPALRRAYAGPELTLAPRISHVLAPVHALLPGLSTYVVRRLAREIGRQLDAGTEPERLRGRLEHRYASTLDIRDPGRWLLGAAVVRHGCGLTACESGRIWKTGQACQVCVDIRLHRPPAAADPEPPRARPPLPRPAGTHPYIADRRGACARCDMPPSNARHRHLEVR